MKIFAIKTQKIKPFRLNLFEILDKYLPRPKEKSIIAITSKIVSITEGRVIKIGQIKKKKLIEKEADYFLPPEKNKYNVSLTIKENLLLPSAGIDESNGNGYYILWPENPQEAAVKIRQYLLKKFSIKKLGIIITDSKTSPLRRGTTGVAIGYCGFSPLKNYIGKPDLFGRKFKMTEADILDALAAAAVLTMGEGNEQTPVSVIEGVPFVKFQNKNPSEREINHLRIGIKDDLYASLLKNAKWKKGGKKKIF